MQINRQCSSNSIKVKKSMEAWLIVKCECASRCTYVKETIPFIYPCTGYVCETQFEFIVYVRERWNARLKLQNT